MRHFVIIALLVFVTGCNQQQPAKDASYYDNETIPHNPDHWHNAIGETIELDAADYFFLDTLRFSWQQIEGPLTVTIHEPDSAVTEASGFNVPGVYKFRLTVTDNHGAWDTDDMTVTVLPGEVLPVHLLAFTGEARGPVNVLNWRTASEINNDRFELEKAADTTRLQTFATVPGSGTSNTLRNYTYTDNSPGYITYYRLRQVDYDGRATHSNIIKVVNVSISNRIVVNNPITGQLQINIVSRNRQTATLLIYNSVGQMMMQRQFNCVDGPNQFLVETNAWAAGMYHVQIRLGDLLFTKKVFKQ